MDKHDTKDSLGGVVWVLEVQQRPCKMDIIIIIINNNNNKERPQ
jgi:hypothetical protein